MTTLTAGQPAGQRREAGPRTTLLLLRVSTALVAVATVAQPVLAGIYLGGDADALGLHEANAHVVFSLMFIQGCVAIAYWLVGTGRGWPALAAFALVALVFVQEALGYARLLALHIPVGVATVLLVVLLTIWVFGPAARRPGRRRSRREGSS